MDLSLRLFEYPHNMAVGFSESDPKRESKKEGTFYDLVLKS